MFDYGIHDYHVEVKNDDRFKKIFFKNSQLPINFDLFAAAFWLLSRYEEYLPHKSDVAGRFSFRSSLAYQYDFLKFPLVNLWLSILQDLLAEQFSRLEFKQHEYSFLSTVDVDNVYKYKYKGFVRTIAGLITDKGLGERLKRMKILLGKEKDPFDCYDFLIETHKKNQTKAIYFFLLGDYGPNDKNHSSTDLRFQALIKKLGDYSLLGLHPSFGSNDHVRQLKKEVARLGNITHRFITRSRQHFGMLRFPHTYKDLLQAGLTLDYSMGYTNQNGFRASYCFPYRWYSLEIESASSLMLHPFCISEVTLLDEAEKNNLDPLKLAQDLISEVFKYNGEMISIFHNHTFDEPVKKFYEQFLLAVQAPKN